MLIMNFIPHSELLLGSSFWRLETETQMYEKRAQAQEKSLSKLETIKKEKQKIIGNQASLSVTGCSLGLGAGLAVGAIPWLILVVIVFNYSNIISNIMLMISLVVMALVVGLLLSIFVGKFIFHNIAAPNSPDTDKKLIELIRQEKILLKNIS